MSSKDITNTPDCGSKEDSTKKSIMFTIGTYLDVVNKFIERPDGLHAAFTNSFKDCRDTITYGKPSDVLDFGSMNMLQYQKNAVLTRFAEMGFTLPPNDVMSVPLLSAIVEICFSKSFYMYSTGNAYALNYASNVVNYITELIQSVKCFINEEKKYTTKDGEVINTTSTVKRCKLIIPHLDHPLYGMHLDYAWNVIRTYNSAMLIIDALRECSTDADVGQIHSTTCKLIQWAYLTVAEYLMDTEEIHAQCQNLFLRVDSDIMYTVCDDERRECLIGTNLSETVVRNILTTASTMAECRVKEKRNKSKT